MHNFLFSELISFLKENNYVNDDDYNNIEDFIVSGFSSINANIPGTVTWLKDKQSIDWNQMKVAIVVCGKGVQLPKNLKCIAIKVDNPRLVFINILQKFYNEKPRAGIEKTAVIGDNCTIGNQTYIGNYVVIGDNVTIGNNTSIHSNAVVYDNTEIGSDCIIHSGAVLGADGFGFERNEHGLPIKFPHIGGLILGDNVEIKSHTCINRGTLDNTEINDNVKIDDLCHIGHNVIIKENTIIASGCSISGNVVIGINSWVAPRSAVRNRIVVGDRAFIGIGAVVIRDVNDDDIVTGVPAKSIKKE